MPGIYIWLN